MSGIRTTTKNLGKSFEQFKKSSETYRAWSGDWNKSLTFSGDLINSPKWNNFKAFCEKKLGEGWGWELSINSNPIKTDEGHFELKTFVYPDNL